MLAAENRLRRAADIARVYKRGVYGAGQGYLSVKATPNNRPESRAVVVVGKKVDKRATVRNRIRRRLAALLRLEWATVTTGYDIVVTVHADLSALPAPQLREALLTALSRARVFSSNTE